MTDLDDFLLFRSACRKTDASLVGQKNACEDAREDSERENSNDSVTLCYDDDNSSWDSDSLDNDY